MAESRSDQFKPKYTHFHPQSTVWVVNPFDYDIKFQVADERNVPYQYRIAANSTAELPGGMIATLGVKTIVDALIADRGEDMMHIYEQEFRQKYEDEVIKRIKDAPVMAEGGMGGEIDLSVKISQPEPEKEPDPEAIVNAFTQKPMDKPISKVDEGITQTVNASLGTDDQVVEVD